MNNDLERVAERCVSMLLLAGCRSGAAVLANKDRPLFVELFSGSGHMAAAACANHGAQVETVDLDTRGLCNPSMRVDLDAPLQRIRVARRMIDALSSGALVYAHASPPCEKFSVAGKKLTGALFGAVHTVNNGMSLMDAYAARFTLENPGPWVKRCCPPLEQERMDLSLWACEPYRFFPSQTVDIDYCQYEGGSGMKKRTRFAFSDPVACAAFAIHARRCPGNAACARTVKGTHPSIANVRNYAERAAIPQPVADLVVGAIMADHQRLVALVASKLDRVAGDWSIPPPPESRKRPRAPSCDDSSKDIIVVDEDDDEDEVVEVLPGTIVFLKPPSATTLGGHRLSVNGVDMVVARIIAASSVGGSISSVTFRRFVQVVPLDVVDKSNSMVVQLRYPDPRSETVDVQHAQWRSMLVHSVVSPPRGPRDPVVALPWPLFTLHRGVPSIQAAP